MNKRMKTTVDVDGSVISFIHDRELSRRSRRCELLTEAEARLLSDGRFKPSDETLLFKAYHASGYAIDQRNKGAMCPGRTLRGLSELRRRLVDRIVNENIGLVHEMRRRSAGLQGDLDDLISEGLWTLFRAAAGFDPWRGFRFSTYACRSLLRAYHAVGKRRSRNSEQLARSRTHFEQVDSAKPPPHDPDFGLQVERLRQVLDHNTAGLTPVERLILERRILHADSNQPETLVALGEVLNLSKEGVRQIQLGALAKLRMVFDPQVDDGQDEITRRRAKVPA